MRWRNVFGGGAVFGIDALRLLVTVAGTGSFTKAAVRLNYTQSAVSRRIASLEQRAGGPLFERLPRGGRLNPADRALHRHAVQVLDRPSGAVGQQVKSATMKPVMRFLTHSMSLVSVVHRRRRAAKAAKSIVVVKTRALASLIQYSTAVGRGSWPLPTACTGLPWAKGKCGSWSGGGARLQFL
jgi:molybdenum-dependent DNA-binding transcriptional regulator ModE